LSTSMKRLPLANGFRSAYNIFFKLEFAELKQFDFTLTDFIANLTIDNIAMATFLGVLLHIILPGKESAYGQQIIE
jgi:xanthine/uracil permease